MIPCTSKVESLKVRSTYRHGYKKYNTEAHTYLHYNHTIVCNSKDSLKKNLETDAYRRKPVVWVQNYVYRTIDSVQVVTPDGMLLNYVVISSLVGVMQHYGLKNLNPILYYLYLVKLGIMNPGIK